MPSSHSCDNYHWEKRFQVLSLSVKLYFSSYCKLFVGAEGLWSEQHGIVVDICAVVLTNGVCVALQRRVVRST